MTVIYVTFPTSGNRYSNGSSNEGTGVKNLDNDGHRENLIPLFSEMVAENAIAIETIQEALGNAEGEATAAAASAAAADASADAAALSEAAAAASALAVATTLSATSSTSMTIGTGSKSFTMTSGKGFNVGSRIRVARTSSPTNYMEGVITAFNSGSGITSFTSDLVGGSGSSITDWSITIAGNKGDTGATGPAGANGFEWAPTTAGTSAAYTATFSPVIASYTIGQPLIFIVHTNCAAGATLNAGPEAKPLFLAGAAVAADALVAGVAYLGVYDGTNLQVLGAASGGGDPGVYDCTVVASSGSSRTLDFTAVQSYEITLDANCTFSFTLPTVPSGKMNEYIVTLKQDNTGGRTITWPSNGTTTIWSGTASKSTPPVLNTTATSITVIRLKQKGGTSAVIATVEGTNIGSSSGNIPVAGVYLAGGPNTPGATPTLYASSDGYNFADTGNLNANEGIQDIVYNPVHACFVTMNAKSGNTTPAQRFERSTNNGSAWSAASGSSSTVSRDARDRIVLFPNGNMTGRKCDSSGGGNLPFSSNGGSSWSDKGHSSLSGNFLHVSRSGNNAVYIVDGSNSGVYTTDGMTTTPTTITQTGVTDTAAAANLNGNYVFGGATGNVGYKTTVNGTALTTVTSNLASQPFKGGVYGGSKYVLFTAQSVSNNSTINGTYTSRTSAFFTTAGMTGNIVDMVVTAAGVIIATTDTGDEARSTDGGDSWTKTASGNNFLSGLQIYSIRLINGNAYLAADGGKGGYTSDGLAVSQVMNAGGAHLQCFAGG